MWTLIVITLVAGQLQQFAQSASSLAMCREQYKWTLASGQLIQDAYCQDGNGDRVEMDPLNVWRSR
jgi:hypothetical protein